MPVVIKEMRVKVNVEEPDREQQLNAATEQNASEDREIIIDACVEKVLQVLEQKALR